MSEFFSAVRDFFTNGLLSSISLFDILDIALMTVAIYQVLKFFKNTRGIHVLKGLGLLILALAIASWLGLPTITWILSSVFASGVVILMILFQPEFRRAFESLGRGHLADASYTAQNIEETVNQLVTVCEHLSRRRVGALLVFTRKSDLKDIIETGTSLDALVSASLIENVFEPNTPLHDGAMIVSGNRVVAAGCFLPLSENNTLEKTLGTRHRAALGMSERSDAVIVVVSEETGVISCARQGVFRRYLDLEALRTLLTDLYTAEAQSPKSVTAKLFARLFGKEDEPHAEN